MNTIADRLRQARQTRYESAREAALDQGWTVSTYTSHENGTRGLRPDQAQRYARAFGVSVAWLLGLSTQYEAVAIGPGELEIVGTAAAGVWHERPLDGHLAIVKRLQPKTAGAERMDKFRVRVGDNSVNKYIQAGEFAICERVNLNELRVGALVAVERSRGDLVEVSIRQVAARNADKLTLVYASSEARLAGKVEVQPSDDDLTIVGVVTGRYADLTV